LEQELSANFGQRHIANFIERDQIVTSPTRRRAPELQLMFGLDQFVDQRRSSGEADREARWQAASPSPSAM
jgi:hypothetical protein